LRPENKRVYGKEYDYIKEVLDSEFRSSKASNMVKRAEDAFSKLTDSKFSVAFVNGTATLHTAIEALGIGAGDEVIVPPLTMSATAFSVLQANATPVFADVDPKTFQIDSESVASKITSKTKAVMSVALYGTCPDYSKLLSALNSIPLIEDNAEAIGTTFNGKLIGSFGITGSYSFQSSKHLSSGEGGMLTINDESYADKVRKIQSLGYAAVSAKSGKISKLTIQDPNYSRHEILGWNYRMSDLAAAVVLGQIENSQELLEVRLNAAHELNLAIGNCDWLEKQEVHAGATHSYWAFPVVLKHPKITWHQFRDKFMEFGGKGIYAAWQLTYLEPAFQTSKFLNRENLMNKYRIDEYKRGLCPVAEYLQPRILAFRTNEWDSEQLQVQTNALRKTIDFLS